jgi:hypothetical protein
MAVSECTICCDEFEERSLVTFLPCMHAFHAACVAKWLDRKPECPTCKTKITEENLSVA